MIGVLLIDCLIIQFNTQLIITTYSVDIFMINWQRVYFLELCLNPDWVKIACQDSGKNISQVICMLRRLKNKAHSKWSKVFILHTYHVGCDKNCLFCIHSTLDAFNTVYFVYIAHYMWSNYLFPIHSTLDGFKTVYFANMRH